MRKELDREVAEKVMGWRKYKFDWVSDLGGFERRVSIFSPSSDIKDAFQVVEKMRKLGYDIELGDNWTYKKIWYCEFVYNISGLKWLESGEGACEAICRASLAAIEGNKP